MRNPLIFFVLITGCAGDDTDATGPTEGAFTALTYNVHGLPSTITGDDTPGRVAQIGPMLNAFDVIGVQEDFIPESQTLLDDSSDRPYTWRHGEKLDEARAYGSGLTTFSVFDASEVIQPHYPVCFGTLDAGSDCLASKGFQVIRMEITPGVSFDFYNTHLDASGSAEDSAARSAQVDLLIESMNGFSAGQAILFTGDTNIHSDDPVRGGPLMARWLSEVGLLDACDETECSEPGRIDRIFFRESSDLQLRVTSWAVEDTFVDDSGNALSDHDALSATIEWQRKDMASGG